MLSDHEQRALLELQRQFLAEDPDFARSFDEVGQRDSRSPFNGWTRCRDGSPRPRSWGPWHSGF